jgi:hypothetical protein
VVNEEHRWEAPGTLELVRTFLNTDLPEADRERWATSFPGVPQPTPGQLATLIELCDGLRGLLAAAPAPVDAAWLGGWFERTGLSPRVTVQGDALAIRLACPARSGLAGAVVEAVAAALADGTWARLRQCPACHYVFWDRTRNASKVWCAMYAGTDGRACGSIAKVRRYRARQAAAGEGRIPPPAQ